MRNVQLAHYTLPIKQLYADWRAGAVSRSYKRRQSHAQSEYKTRQHDEFAKKRSTGAVTARETNAASVFFGRISEYPVLIISEKIMM